MKWKRGDKWHQVSDCWTWVINKTGGPSPVYMLVKRTGIRDGDEIVHVGTRQECEAKAREVK